jgi:hypothetical protein
MLTLVPQIPRLPSLTQSTREELKNMPPKSKPSPKRKAQGKVRDIKPGKNPKGGTKGSIDPAFIRR